MNNYKIIKDNEVLGPFDIDEITEFVKSGLILKRDYAYDVLYPNSLRTIDFFLKIHGLNISVEHKGNFISQIKDIGGELIIPPTIFTKEPWIANNKLFFLALIGLALSGIIAISPFLSPYIIFYFISLYFSIIWGLFFYYLFKTEQVRLKTAVVLFFATQITTNLIFFVLQIGQINPFEGLYENNSAFVALLSCIFGIGVPEETVKVIPIIAILYYSKQVLKPQTIVFYGLISGIAFGVYEGVSYQLGPNFQLLLENSIEDGYVYSFISNIARLTSLPFLHAVWCGIASYFVSFAFLYPRYRISLYTLAVMIPATIHGVYDYVCFNIPISILTIPIVLVGVILLMVYLNIRYDFHSKLSD